VRCEEIPTGCNIPEDSILHSYRREILKSYIGATLSVISNRRTLGRNTKWENVPSSPILVAPMKEARSASETSVLQEPHDVTSQKMAFFKFTRGSTYKMWKNSKNIGRKISILFNQYTILVIAKFSHIASCSQYADRRFGGMYHLHLQVEYRQLAAHFTLVSWQVNFRTRSYRRYAPPKRRFARWLHGAISQKMATLVTTTAETTDHTIHTRFFAVRLPSLHSCIR
jgi:hypothetical protein